jgi:hypothetical protein
MVNFEEFRQLTFRALHLTEFPKLTTQLTLTFVWCNLPQAIHILFPIAISPKAVDTFETKLETFLKL